MKLFLVGFLWLTVALVGTTSYADSLDHTIRESRSQSRSCVKRPNPKTCTTIDLQYDLMAAIRYRRKEEIVDIVGRLKDLNFRYGEGWESPLSRAVYALDRDTVSLLLRKGADPLALDPHGRWFLYNVILGIYSTPRWLDRETVECVRLILEKATLSGQRPLTQPLDATVLFYNGAKELNLELLKLFLAYGAEPTRPGSYATFARNAFDAAIAKEDLEAIHIMTSQGTRISREDLDERAFDALVKHKSKILTVLRVAGADPARHVNASPKMLFDAVGPTGSIQTLEFLLSNGANPNPIEKSGLRTNILVSALHDLDKVQLLLKHGTDPKFKDNYGYTALFHILSASVPPPSIQPATLVSWKTSLVRLLLDYGVSLNDNHGGQGQWGALGATRREDRELIQFLIHRGATLSYKVGGPSPWQELQPAYPQVPIDKELGPITIAIDFLERDDLALALLARDRKVVPQDRYALVQAVRRGWRDVIEALIRAGADPNVADMQGITSLAMAERRKDEFLIKTLKAAGAKVGTKSAKPSYKFEGLDEFHTFVANEIDEVFLFDPPRFALHPGRSSEKTSFVIYGQDVKELLVEIKCERSAKFEIVANMNKAGSISVGVCDREAKRIGELASTSKQRVATMLESFDKDGTLTTEMAKHGLVYSYAGGPNNSEMHYFPIILVGHGIIFVPTAVLISKRKDQAIIVHGDVMGLCDANSSKGPSPTCADIKKALVEIAQRLFLWLQSQQTWSEIPAKTKDVEYRLVHQGQLGQENHYTRSVT